MGYEIKNGQFRCTMSDAAATKVVNGTLFSLKRSPEPKTPNDAWLAAWTITRRSRAQNILRLVQLCLVQEIGIHYEDALAAIERELNQQQEPKPAPGR